MAIRFSCSCGQTITARNEFVGRRVQCNTCKKVQTVPARGTAVPTKLSSPRAPATPVPMAAPATLSPPSPPPTPRTEVPLAEPVGSTVVRMAAPVTLVPGLEPRPAVVRFRCLCGGDYQARQEHVGEPTRCPRCGEVLFVPSRTAAANEPVLAARERPGRYAPYREGLTVGKRLLLVVLVLLLLGAGGYGAWEFYFKGIAANVRQERTRQLSALDLVPPDSFAFASIRLADVWKNKLNSETLTSVPGFSTTVEQFAKKTGLTPADVDRVVVVLPDAPPLESAGAVQLKRAPPGRFQGKPPEQKSEQKLWVAFDLKKKAEEQTLRKALGLVVVREHAGKKYYATAALPSERQALHFVNERLVVWGSEPGMKAFLARQVKAGGPLRAALRLAAGPSQMVVGVNPPAGAIKALTAQIPKQYSQFTKLLEVKTLTLSSRTQGRMETVRLDLDYGDTAKARSASSLVNGLVLIGRFGLSAAKAQVPEELYKLAHEALSGLKIKAEGSVMQVELTYDQQRLMNELKKQMKELLPAVTKVRESAVRTQASNNLKQIVLAMHLYADAHGGNFPPAVITDRLGRPLYSWRVALLPYLGEANLYRQFRPTEPWNSAHNGQLLARTPKVYQSPGAPAQAGMTYIQVFTGKNTPFVFNQPPRLPASFGDGTSNTILVAEAAQAVPWTQPRDMPYSEQFSPLRQIGRRYGGGGLVGMANASVRFLSPLLTEKTLRAAITPNGREVLGPDW